MVVNKQRQVSLDIFRGVTLAAMLLVNNPGSWSDVYAPLLHASWHGLTPTDLIFPFFMFIVGAAMFHSMQSFVPSKGQPGNIPWFKIAKRTLVLFVIGFLLNIFPFTGEPESWRVMGVLQRIALCYGISAVLICVLTRKQILVASIVILVSYWLLLHLADPPFTLENNLVRRLDITILGASHLYQGFGVAFDPEGLLSCLPAVVTVLAGFLTSAMLAESKSNLAKINTLFIWSLVALVVCYVWQWWFPVNKALWTSTYVLLTNACAWLFLIVIIYLHDVKGIKRGFAWTQVYGSNPLFIYVLSWLFASSLYLVKWTSQSGTMTNAHQFIFESLSQWMSAKNASLVFALLVVGLFYLCSLFLYKRKIFVKI
ncbi:heparan-alpha-glucosaminide N-acetyltransferase domain-containing protein [Paraglaciecola aquimarina]|uniref:Heparan-alpha-glucosaminide N-acetyltransferase domain-containing protein n=1 Tax=Paraglaciecola algarum TaxID=3050085 RepID=A0ABS9D3G1_9ALTE|nr:heparan-alpha-glucosaminide N-acetyltransferase domain-containing protein [Paraglaciecola sp. G1-23]MCF2946583.1 heparan-alpha-glucosaminide N-acetyltransferase domain-containing protein [Paraglaciecola sp. G1-23]